jgi:Ca2+/Na+ antiporter
MAKKYSVNWENEEVVSVEVDGVLYEDPDHIPDPEDRARILQLMDNSPEEDIDPEFDKAFENFDDEFRELESQSAKFPIVIVAVFLIVAGITLTIAIISGISTGRAMAREQSAPGQVVDLTLRTSQGGRNSQGTYQAPQDYYYPVVEFSLPDGTPKTVQLSEGSWPPAYEKGEQVTILYDPEKPLNARIQSTSSSILMWLLPGITGVVGVSFLIAAVFVVWFFHKKPADKGEKNPEFISKEELSP